MTCQRELQKQGKPYPRTCWKCALGPCIEAVQVNPRALRLAHDLLAYPRDLGSQREASNELRRLHALTAELLEALQNLENDDGAIPKHAWLLVQAAIAKATAI